MDSTQRPTLYGHDTPGSPPPAGADEPFSGHHPHTAHDPVQAPARIMRKAAEHDLGALVMAQRGSNPIANALFCVAAIAVMSGIIWAIAALELRFLRFVAVLLVAGIVVAAIMGVMALAAGFTAAYLFENGLICTRNGVASAARWQQVDRLLLWRAGGKTGLHGKLLCYYVVTTAGRRMSVEARPADQGDPFGDALRATVAGMGRPVVESGPAAGVLRPRNG